jgi:hypothetical protein
METIDIYNNKSTETHFVTNIDIQNMDPCIFQNRMNPVTGARCRETFSNMNIPNMPTCYTIPNDPIVKIWIAALGMLSMYIFFCWIKKHGMVH